MKNAILSFLLIMSTTSLLAQNSNMPGATAKEQKDYTNSLNGAGNNNNNQAGLGAQCAAYFGNKEIEVKLDEKGLPILKPMAKAGDCVKLAMVAKIENSELGSTDTRPTADGRIVCRKTGGYTADYASCKKVSYLYDSVLLAETAMFAAQKATVEQSNTKAAALVAQKIQEGDGQNAAIDATIARNELNAKLNKTQALAYASAVTAIAGSVALWRTKSSFAKGCSKHDEKMVKAAEEFGVSFTKEECTALLKEKKDSDEVFRNESAKAQFVTAVGSFLMKAAEAKKRAGINEFVANKLEAAKIPTDEEDLMLDPCVVNAASELCKQSASQGNISSGTFQGNTVDFGAGAGSTFDFGAGNGVGDIAAGTPAGATESVADVISPFEDQAKIANGILDPAAAASAQAGGANSPGGGGGAGGGGGGGSASLGDDLAGASADGNKDPEISTSKLSGKYKGGKGGGFQGVAKGGKEDANPFASLFDNKDSAGGIEEDRSIASDSGEGSGLFQKISKKYGQIQQEKRLDNQAME